MAKKPPIHIPDLITECTRLKDKLGRAKLWKTTHSMEQVIKDIGWEYADMLQKEGK